MTAPSAWRPGPPTATASAPWTGSGPRSPSRWARSHRDNAASDANGAQVQREVCSPAKIVVDPGYAVDPVHYGPPNQPRSPNQPRKSYDNQTDGRIGAD